MRSFFLTNVIACSFLHLAHPAAAEDARTLLDRAIKAHGGAARLELTKKGHLKAKTEVNQSNVISRFEVEEWFDLPSRFKRVIDTTSDGVLNHQEEGFIGGKRWSRVGTGPVRESPPLLPPLVVFLTELLLLRDKDAQLTTLADDNTKVGHPLAGLRASYAQKKSDYFFDRSKGLLALQIGTTNNSPYSQNGSDEKVRTFFDDYRDIQGVLYPMRWKVLTETYSSTITLSSIEFARKIDEKTFLRPQTPVPVGQDSRTTVRDTASRSPADNGENTSPPKNWLLFVATVGAGLLVGAVWLIVRASKRGKQDVPPS